MPSDFSCSKSFISCSAIRARRTGGEKMIYQWNADLNIITKQTEESKRIGEILKGLKLGDAGEVLINAISATAD
jgi:hypothetical protein